MTSHETGDWLQIVLINRSACLKKITQNLHYFQNALEIDLSSEKILERIIASKDLFYDGLKNRHSLYGMLLGYGDENAIGFEELAANYYLSRKPIPFHDEDVLLPLKLHLPYFMVFTDKYGHDALREEYEMQRKDILDSLNNEKNDLLTLVSQRFEKSSDFCKALTPACYISENLCMAARHYASKNDIVPDWFDKPGQKACAHTTTLLEPHPTATGLDHSFKSETYEQAIMDSFEWFKYRYGQP